MKQFLLVFLFLFCLYSCLNKPKNQINYPKLILKAYDTLMVKSSYEMESSIPKVYGINILDSLNFNTFWYDSSNFSEDYLNGNDKKGDGLFVFIDTLNIDFHCNEMGINTFLPPPPPPQISSRKDSIFFNKIWRDHLRFLEKRKKTHYKTFPLYIYNYSNSNSIVQKPIGGDLYFITEAKDENDSWKPIEFWEQRRFLCGTGHENYVLKPKHFIVSAVKKFECGFKTKLRVRFASFNKVFYSNEYTGYINKSQFDSTKVLKDIKLKFSHWEEGEINKRIKRSFLNSTY